MTLVVDTSVIVKWFVSEEGHEEAVGLLETGERLVCPDFALAEAANVLWRKVRLEEIGLSQASVAVTEIPNFFDEVLPSSPLLSDALALASSLEHSVYDCVFLAAAVRDPDSALVTDDRRFAQKCTNAGYAEKVRVLRGNPLLVEMTEAEMVELGELAERFDAIIRNVEDRLAAGSQPGPLRILNLRDLRPAFDSPVYATLRQRIELLSSGAARAIIAICWYGRGVGSQGFERDYDNAAHLASDPARHAAYIIGLLQFLGPGVAKLRSSHPHLLPRDGM